MRLAASKSDQGDEETTTECHLSQEGQQAFLRLIEKQKQNKCESDSDDSWGDACGGSSADDLDEEEKDDSPPKKPPRMFTELIFLRVSL